jgi:hypothetical protein
MRKILPNSVLEASINTNAPLEWREPVDPAAPRERAHRSWFRSGSTIGDRDFSFAGGCIAIRFAETFCMWWILPPMIWVPGSEGKLAYGLVESKGSSGPRCRRPLLV